MNKPQEQEQQLNYSPAMHLSDSAVRIFLDPAEVLEKIKLFLRNEGYATVEVCAKCGNQAPCGCTAPDVQARVIPVPNGKPLVNEYGIHKIMYLIESHINIAIVQANLKEDQIKKMLFELNQALIFLMCSQWRVYDLQKAHFTLLVETVDHQCEAFFSRTCEDGERRRFQNRSWSFQPARPKEAIPSYNL